MSDPDFFKWLKNLVNWVLHLPFFTILIFWVSIIIFLASTALYPINSLLCNDSISVIKFYQFWRLFTPPFVNFQLIELIFGLYSFLITAKKFERDFGSLTFIIDFFLKTLIIQSTLCLLGLLISTRICYCDLWTLVMIYLTIDCACNPEMPTLFLCFPFQIKKKYYPFAIIIFLFILSRNIDFSLVFAMFLGLIEAYFFNGMILRISYNKIFYVETSFPIKCIKNKFNYVSCENAESGYFNSNFNLNNDQSSFNSLRSNAMKGTNSFYSGKGIVIGGKAKSRFIQKNKNNEGEINSINDEEGENQRLIEDINEDIKEKDNLIIEKISEDKETTYNN